MSSGIHPTRLKNHPIPKAKPKPIRKAPTTVSAAEAAAPTSISHLRRKIRDLTRLLSRATTTNEDGTSSLPPAARIQTERALASYQRDLELAQKHHQEKKLADRYRMVRFFERQKATRQLNRLVRTCPPPLQRTLQQSAQILAAQVNLNYTLYFPLSRKYISLYRDCGADPKTQKAKEEILADIKQSMEDKTLGKRTTSAEEADIDESDEEDQDDNGGVNLNQESTQKEKELKKDKPKDKPKKKDNLNPKHKDKSKKKKNEKDDDDSEVPADQATSVKGSFFEF